MLAAEKEFALGICYVYLTIFGLLELQYLTTWDAPCLCAVQYHSGQVDADIPRNCLRGWVRTLQWPVLIMFMMS